MKTPSLNFLCIPSFILSEQRLFSQQRRAQQVLR